MNLRRLLASVLALSSLSACGIEAQEERCDASRSTIGQWQYVAASNGATPANEFIIYATTTSGADCVTTNVPGRLVHAPWSRPCPAWRLRLCELGPGVHRHGRWR
jgi:hypothetical protein